MKLSIKLLLFAFLAQHLFLDSIIAAKSFQRDGDGPKGNSAILDDSIEHFDDGLFGANMVADQVQKSDVGKDSGDNVYFIGQGEINLTVPNGLLIFQLCSNCTGSVHICYESDSPDSDLNGDCPESSQCVLQIEGIKPSNGFNGVIYFGSVTPPPYYPKPAPSAVPQCDVIKIEGRPTKFKNSQEFKTCTPKIDENGMIKLFVKRAEDNNCRVEAVSAKIKYPEIITTPSPQTSPKPPNSTAVIESTSESSLPWWGIMLICVLLFGIIIGIGIAVYCVCFKHPSSKKQISPTDSTIPPPTAVITTNNAHESTVSKPIQAPPKSTKVESGADVAAKPESSLSKEPKKKTEATLSKEPLKKIVEKKKAVEKKKHVEKAKKKAKAPEKKKKVVEGKKKIIVEQSTTTENVPAPPKPTSTKPMPVVPFSKSQTTSSVLTAVEKAMKKNNLAAVESVPDSLHRNCAKECDTDLVDQMKELYPDVKRVILKIEVLLFCVSISEMLSKMNEMVAGFVKTLSELGIKFDEQRRMTDMSNEGRDYLDEPSTSGLAALFAFGAEFHEFIIDDMDIMEKFSIPHLMVIALQPRFPDMHRRKACTYIRRQLPLIRKSFTAAERKALPFPVSMIEKAFEHDPKYFLDINAIDTDSDGHRKKMDEAEKEMVEKKKDDGRNGDGQKRK